MRKTGHKTLSFKSKQNFTKKNPRLGQRRAGIKFKKPHISPPIDQSVKNPQKIPDMPKIQKEVINMPNFAIPVQSMSNPCTEVINRRMM